MQDKLKSGLFPFNPFGGLDANEIGEVIIFRHDLEHLIKLINDGQPKIMEFVGKKGRGKSTHLKDILVSKN